MIIPHFSGRPPMGERPSLAIHSSIRIRWIVLLLCVVFSPARADETGDEAPDHDPLTENVMRKEPPQFAFMVPKKKSVRRVLDGWRQVDLEKRVRLESEKIDREVAEEKEKRPPDGEKIEDLEGRKRNLQMNLKPLLLRLESKGTPGEFIEVRYREVSVSTKIDQTLPQLSEYTELELIVDEDLTDERQRKRKVSHHRKEFKAKLEGREVFKRLDVLLVPAPDGDRQFRFEYEHAIPDPVLTRKKKREIDLLRSLFRV